MDLLKMVNDHKKLQAEIKQERKRTLFDCVTSCIAEIIEFNEELGYFSHKTWKQKESTPQKRLEEYIDILFFFCEILELQDMKDEKIKNLSVELKGNYEMIYGMPVVLHPQTFYSLFYKLIMFDYLEFLIFYLKIGAFYAFTPEMIEKAFYDKLDKNYKRIGKEWR